MKLLVTASLIAALHPAFGGEMGNPESEVVLGPPRSGRATRYGTSFNGSRLGCGGTYWTWDRDIIAVGPSRYREWPCGTTLQVTGPHGTIWGTRRDSCPGCDAYGVVVDLSEAGHAAVCGVGTCTVTVRQVLAVRAPAETPPVLEPPDLTIGVPWRRWLRTEATE